MSNGDGGDWLSGAWEVAWDICKYVLSAMGFVLSGGGLWALRRYSADRAMLLRHEERLNQVDTTMGELVAHRKVAEKGPLGEELERELKLLHRRASKASKLAEDTQSESEARFAAIEASIVANFDWIKKSLDRIEKK